MEKTLSKIIDECYENSKKHPDQTPGKDVFEPLIDLIEKGATAKNDDLNNFYKKHDNIVLYTLSLVKFKDNQLDISEEQFKVMKALVKCGFNPMMITLSITFSFFDFTQNSMNAIYSLQREYLKKELDKYDTEIEIYDNEVKTIKNAGIGIKTAEQHDYLEKIGFKGDMLEKIANNIGPKLYNICNDINAKDTILKLMEACNNKNTIKEQLKNIPEGDFSF